jgi:predicted  nucleic acid-binding Zn-ribbon protein
MQELTQLNSLVSKHSGKPNTQMQNYSLSSKLKITKQDINRLRNEKINLEATEHEYKKELKALKASVEGMHRRCIKQSDDVISLKKQVGSITAKINGDIEINSAVKSSEVKLQTYLKKGKETKEKLLKEVNTRKKNLQDVRHRNSDTITMRPVDWNQIDNESSYYSQTKYSSIDEKSVNKSEECSKLRNSIDYRVKQGEFSMINFDPD